MTRLLLLPALAFALTACEPVADTGADDPVAEEIDVATPTAALAATDAFTPAAPVGGTGGVFMTVSGGSAADTLVGARSAVAERVEVHETYADGDLRGMREVEGGIPVPAGGTVALEPGGYHIMLINLGAETAVGDTVEVELDFASGATVPVRVPVVGLDAMPTAE